MKLLIRRSGAFVSYTKAVKRCERYDDGNILSTILPYIEQQITTAEEAELIQAYNKNSLVRETATGLMKTGQASSESALSTISTELLVGDIA